MGFLLFSKWCGRVAPAVAPSRRDRATMDAKPFAGGWVCGHEPLLGSGSGTGQLCGRGCVHFGSVPSELSSAVKRRSEFLSE